MSDNQLAVIPKASDALALSLGIDKSMMLSTFKAQCFRGVNPDQVSDEQLAAFVSTAHFLKVNPLIPGMLYAYPDKGGKGITPILGPDGVFKKLDEAIMEGKIVSYECTVYPEDPTKPPTHAIAVIKRNNDSTARYVAYWEEWYVDSNPNWKWKKRHMLWLRAVKQCARQVIHGLPEDNDEYTLREAINVTGTGETPTENLSAEPKKERAAAPRRGAGKGADAGNAEPKNVTPPANEQPAQLVEQQAPPAQQQAAPAQRPAATPPATAAKPAPAAPAGAVSTAQNDPRAFLKERETLSAVVQVLNLTTMLANVKEPDGTIRKDVPSVQVEVKGGFNGMIFHFGGAKASGGGVVANDVWKEGNVLKVSVYGKKARSGAVIAEVKSVGLNSAAAAEETPPEEF